jgi:hypothetical protein
MDHIAQLDPAVLYVFTQVVGQYHVFVQPGFACLAWNFAKSICLSVTLCFGFVPSAFSTIQEGLPSFAEQPLLCRFDGLSQVI